MNRKEDDVRGDKRKDGGNKHWVLNLKTTKPRAESRREEKRRERKILSIQNPLTGKQG